MNERIHTTTGFLPRWAIGGAFVVALAVAAYVFWQLVPVLIGAFGGILFAIVLRRIGGWIARHTPLKQRWAVGLLLILIGAGAALAVYQFGQQLVGQVNELSHTLTSSYDQVSSWLTQHGVDLATTNIEQPLLAWLSGFGSALWHLISGALLVLFVMIYVSLSPAVYRTGFVLLFPKS